MLLEVKDIQVYYGAIHAIKGVSFEVNEGEIVTLIGANGAGKTTTLDTIAGLLRSRGGDIVFQGESIAHKAPHRRAGARKGVRAVPAAEGTPPSGRWNALRRRTADAGDLPRDHGPSDVAPA